MLGISQARGQGGLAERATLAPETIKQEILSALENQLEQQIKWMLDMEVVVALPPYDGSGGYGILNEKATAEGGDLTNPEYAKLPSIQEIREKLVADSDKLKLMQAKWEQGFTEIRLVPRYSTQTLIHLAREHLRQLAEDGSNVVRIDREGNRVAVEIEEKDPMWISVTAKEHVDSIDSLYQNGEVGGEGWVVEMYRPLRNLPLAGEAEVIGGRRDLENGRSYDEYQELIKEDVNYYAEELMDVNGFLMRFIEGLSQKVVRYVWNDKNSVITGTVLSPSGRVLWAYWDTDISQLDLDVFDVDGGYRGAGGVPTVRISL